MQRNELALSNKFYFLEGEITTNTVHINIAGYCPIHFSSWRNYTTRIGNWSTLGPFSKVMFDDRAQKGAALCGHPQQWLVGLSSRLLWDLAGKPKSSVFAYLSYCTP
jgi:hypothetical protein